MRCDIYSAFHDVFGTNPQTGFTRRAVDNVGVQYGLAALNARAITKTQFLDLNENVGGFNEDGRINPDHLVPAPRTAADEEALEIACQTGRLVYGRLGLATIPIIDYRAYTDDLKGGDAHQRFHSFALRARLRKANGSADNMVMLHEDFRNGLSSPIRSQLIPFAFRQITGWIKNIKADTAEYDSPVAKAARNKPATLEEGCMTRDATAVFVPEEQVTDPSSVCGALYPVWSYPHPTDPVCLRQAPSRHSVRWVRSRR